MNKFVKVMHEYCYAYTNCQDFSACDRCITPDYVLLMGTHRLAGRDEMYKPATRKQFEQFPGLCLTVHEIITNGDRLAMRFSEHGASLRHGNARAAWGGIALYRWNGERLVECQVEQDYYGRRQQLKTGHANAVEAPAVAPWDTVTEDSNLAAEETVRSLLLSDAVLESPGVVVDDGYVGQGKRRIIVPEVREILDIFSAGDKVAFRTVQHGKVICDFSGDSQSYVGCRGTLHAIGVVTVNAGRVTSGRLIRDRHGLLRRLRS